MTRKAKLPKLSERDALSVLRWLHATNQVTAKQITSALGERERLVAEIKAKLEALGGEGARFLSAASFHRRKRVKRVSATARAAWKAQGRYLGAVRRLSAADRVKVRAIRKKNGVRAAIAAAKRMARK